MRPIHGPRRKPNRTLDLRTNVKELLHELADEVAKAVGSFEGDAGAIMGTNAYGTPTQAIDRIAEEAVLRYLAYNDSDLNVLSEEAGFVDRGGKRTLVLDPIDGSYNAVRGIPLYTTSMAVGVDRLATVSHGIVRHLATGDTYYAEKGLGAFRNGKKVSTRAFEAKDGLFSVYLGSLAAPASYRPSPSGVGCEASRTLLPAPFWSTSCGVRFDTRTAERGDSGCGGGPATTAPSAS